MKISNADMSAIEKIRGQVEESSDMIEKTWISM